MNRRTFLREFLIFVAFFALTAAVMWPWVMNLRDAASDRGDCYTHAYWLWWDYHQTFHDPLHLFDATIFYPYKNTLAFSENDYGVALPFFPLFALGFRPLTVLSVATFMAFVFSGYGMFRLTRTLTGSAGAAWVSGIVFAFLPYHIQRLPHLASITAEWIPLTIEALVLFARRLSWRRAAWVGVCFAMNAVTCVSWFVLTLVPFGLSAVLIVAWYRLWRERNFWVRGAIMFGAASLVVVCFMFPYYRVHQAHGFARSPDDAMGLSALPIHWIAVSLRNKLWAGLGGKAAIDELMLFPGLLPPLLALAGLLLVRPAARAQRALKLPGLSIEIPRRAVVTALDVLVFASLLIALLAEGFGGFHLRLFSFDLLKASTPARPLLLAVAALSVRLLLARPEIIRHAAHEKNLFATFRSNPRAFAVVLALIWATTGFFGSFGMHFYFHRLLYELIPVFRSLRAPVRWAMICYVGLSVLAGLGARRVVELVTRWRPRVPPATVYVVLALLILFEQRVAPIEFVHGEVEPDALTLRLKDTPMAGGLVELPAEKDNYAYYRYTLRAADHGHPIVTSSSSFAPPIVQEIESLTKARPIPDRFLDLLEEIPASYLVVHNAELTPESRRAIEAVVGRGVAAGRLRFVNSYGDPAKRDDLYAVAKTEPGARTEAPAPTPLPPAENAPTAPGGATSVNPLDDTQLYVRQQYLDLLDREPDKEGGDNFAAFLNACNGEPVCLLDRRARGSMDFFHSPEFHETGDFVYRLYETAFGRAPKYAEWSRGVDQLKTAGSQLSLAEGWASSAEFLARYPERMTNTEYVDKLLKTSELELSPAERDALVAGLDGGAETRGAVLLKVANNPSLAGREYAREFVALCYFSYFRRDPDPKGYQDWLKILNNDPQNEGAVVKGFIASGEYRARFSAYSR
ncbi:MAG: DUF4214 domain-containing protein [Pyrinomonadaceae bacterium]